MENEIPQMIYDKAKRMKEQLEALCRECQLIMNSTAYISDKKD